MQKLDQRLKENQRQQLRNYDRNRELHEKLTDK